jgi:hypothetical protein
MISIPKSNLPMSDTDLAVLNEIVKQKKAEQDPTATDSEFWEFFSAQQILRDYQLDPEEVKSGIVGQEATKEISKYWRHKRERRQFPEPLSHTARQQAA